MPLFLLTDLSVKSSKYEDPKCFLTTQKRKERRGEIEYVVHFHQPIPGLLNSGDSSLYVPDFFILICFLQQFQEKGGIL